MNFRITRRDLNDQRSIGQMLFDDVVHCYTLEDVVRELGPNGDGKIPGQTAIPEGTFPLVIDSSKRFGRPMPHILNVPHFEGIRIHWGDTVEDTEGCPLLGFRRTQDAIWDTKAAFEQFFGALTGALLIGPAFITINTEKGPLP